MDCRYWEESSHAVKYENYNSNDGYGRAGDGNLNFAIGGVPSDDEVDYSTAAYLKKGKLSRQQQDPMSHRIIEKRRRDRMNNCLADLSRLIPPTYLKKGRGRVEKTEIIEMAIQHLKYLQDRANGSEQLDTVPISVEHFRLGYQECLSEVMRYLVEGQGYLPTDGLCSQLVGHLQRHCDSIMKGDQLNKPRSNPETTSSSSASSSNYAGHNAGLTHGILRHLDQSHNTRHRKRPTYSDDAVPCLSPVPQYVTGLPDSLEEHSELSKATLTRTLYTDSADRSESEPQLSEETHLHQNSYRNETLRNIRKPDYPANYGPEYTNPPVDEHFHSYKFKNNIKQRFSESQTNGHSDEAHDMRLGCSAARRDQHSESNEKYYKRRRTSSKQVQNYERGNKVPTENCSDDKIINITADSNYSEEIDEPTTEVHTETIVTAPKFPKLIDVKITPKLSGICVPIFALNSVGKFYVPLSVDLEVLAPSAAWREALHARAAPASALHPVTINVNFQPHFSTSSAPATFATHNTKSERESDWQVATPLTVSQFNRS